MKRNWIVTGALAFGVMGAVAPFTFAKDRPVLLAKAEKEIDEQVKYASLPKPVKATVDKERGNHEVTALYHVERDGKEFYRAVIDTKGNDTVIRIKPGGELMTEQEARDITDREVIAKRGTAAGEARTAAARREVRLARDETDGEIVDFDRLPGSVKTEIGRLAKADKVEEVVRYKHNGQTMYRAEVGQGKYTRYIRVGENGQVEGVRGDIDPGEVVKFDRLPGAAKSKIGALAKGGKVDEVIEYKRAGKTYYQAEVQDKAGKSYFYTVDEDGREVESLPRV
ncbi:MAG TPA: hypothetical protein VH475_14305 [Tepidisphaeraceae bacterium]|jgi:hypothetical protein